MKIIEIQKKPNFNYLKFVKRSANESDYDTLITEPCIGVENGEIRFIYDTLDMDSKDVIQALKRIKYPETKRSDGLVSRSRVFGWKPRVTMRADYCSQASLAGEFPAENRVVVSLAKMIEEKYFKNYPEGYNKHKEEVEAKVKNTFRIDGTVFTSGIINKNNKLNYHYDAGNFNKVYSCMPVFKNGIRGGHLALPEYGLGLELAHNSLLMFDGQSILHGVTPIKYDDENSFRYSVVFYSLKQMWKCLEMDEELARIKNLKTTREKDRLNLPQDKIDKIAGSRDFKRKIESKKESI